MTERTGIEWTDATWNPVRGAQEATSKDYWQAGESGGGDPEHRAGPGRAVAAKRRTIVPAFRSPRHEATFRAIL